MPTLRLAIDASRATAGARQFQSASQTVQQSARAGSVAIDQKVGAIGRLRTSIGSTIPGLTQMAGAFTAFLSINTAARALIDFEQGAVGVAKTTNFAGQELSDFEDRIIRMSTNIAAGTTELLAIAQSAGQLGVKGVEDITAFTETVAKLGRASDLAGDEAATILARMLNVTGENMNQVKTLGSVIVELGNNAAATEREIALVATEVAKSTAVFNVSSTEAAALGAAYASIGVDAAVAATSTGKAMRVIDAATRAGGQSLSQLAAIAGVTDEEFRKTWDENSVNGFTLLMKGLGNLIDEGGNVNAVFNELGLSDERVVKTLQPLAKEIEILVRYMKMAREESENVVALDNEVARASETLGNKLIVLGNSFNAIILQARDSTGPLKEFVDVLAQAMQIIAGLRDPHQASASARVVAEALELAFKWGSLFVGLKLGGYFLGIAANASRAVFSLNAFTAAGTRAMSTNLKLGAGAGAAIGGWELGKWATQQFDIIADAGIWLGYELQKIFIKIEYWFKEMVEKLKINWKMGLQDILVNQPGLDIAAKLFGFEDDLALARTGIAIKGGFTAIKKQLTEERDRILGELEMEKRNLMAGEGASQDVYRRFFGTDQPSADEQYLRGAKKAGFSDDEARKMLEGSTATDIYLDRVRKKLADLRDETELLSMDDTTRRFTEILREFDALNMDLGPGTEGYKELLEEITAELQKQNRLRIDRSVISATKDLTKEAELQAKYFGEELEIQRELMYLRRQYEEAGTTPGEGVLEAHEAALRKLKEVEDQARRIEDIAYGIGDAFAMSFEDALMGAKNLGEVLQSLAMDIQRILIRNLVTQPIGNFISQGIMGMMGIGSVASAMGNVFHNGFLQPFKMGGVVTQPTTFPMANGRMGIMGEAGDEGILPLARDKQGRLGVHSSGGGQVVHNHYWNITTPSPESFRRSAGQLQRAVSGALTR